MERLAREIRTELERFGPQAGMVDVLAAWPETVGPMVAANAWPARITREGALQVATTSSTWAFELSQLAPTIVDRLTEKLGERAPKTVRFAVGHVPDAPQPESVRTCSSPLVPSAEAERAAAVLVAGIDDDELRERVARAVALALSKRGSDRPF